MPNMVKNGEVNLATSGWITGKGEVNIKASSMESAYFPWQYNIVFSDNQSIYKGLVNNSKQIYDESNTAVGAGDLLFNKEFGFYVENMNYTDASGKPIKLDMVVQDLNHNNAFDPDSDKVLVGYSVASGTKVYWAGTVFSLDFKGISSAKKPAAGDIYRLDFGRPFVAKDSIMFKVKPEVLLNSDKLKTDMSKIRVVPNPYVMTNTMETSVTNYLFNQPRRIMFTNIPANCTIKIFTLSGFLVKEINVDNAVANRTGKWDLNSENNGTAYWDLMTKENLDAAAGYYIYHVKSTLTGEEKLGKFAIIK